MNHFSVAIVIDCIHVNLSSGWNFWSDNFLLPKVPLADTCWVRFTYYVPPTMDGPPNTIWPELGPD